MTWEVRPCEVPGCALALGHAGEHRSQGNLDRAERSAFLWRLLIIGGVVAAFAWVLVSLR
jgi:hypothetical protein